MKNLIFRRPGICFHFSETALHLGATQLPAAADGAEAALAHALQRAVRALEQDLGHRHWPQARRAGAPGREVAP